MSFGDVLLYREFRREKQVISVGFSEKTCLEYPKMCMEKTLMPKGAVHEADASLLALDGFCHPKSICSSWFR